MSPMLGKEYGSKILESIGEVQINGKWKVLNG